MKAFLKLYSRTFCNKIEVQLAYSEPPKFIIEINNDINIAKKQVAWRIRNMGQLEIEFLLMKWFDKYGDEMSLDQLKNLTTEVLEQEIPELNKYLLRKEPLPQNSKYLREIYNYHYRI